MMSPGNQNLLVFTLDDQAYALSLAAVERILRAVEITPLPQAPEIVLGIINAQGRIIPVIDIRRRFRLPTHGLLPDDRFILARIPKRLLALAVDSVTGVCGFTNQQVEKASDSLPFAGFLQGVAKTDDGLILIHDLETFLSLDEARTLDAAIPQGEA